MTLEMKMDEKWEEGLQAGLLRGHAEGYRKRLISQVCKKLAKGKTVDEIADMLEEEPDNIRLICEAAAKYAPEYDEDFVFKEMGLSDSKLR